MDNRQRFAPYLFELRDTVDAALLRLREVEVAAERWVQLEAKMAADATLPPDTIHSQPPQETWFAALDEQTRIFDSLEAFLAVWARTSLLLFPASSRKGAIKRGEWLRRELRIDSSSPLGHRGLRDSWMHFDERLDAAIARGITPTRQYFEVSAQVSGPLREATLRLLEVDTLTIHFRDRRGALESQQLQPMRDALESLELAVAQTARRERR